MADYKPVVLMSLMLLSFWLMISYLTDSYFVIFLIVSNFILLFACCVSLSGYVIGKYVDGREEPHLSAEIPTISGSQPFVVPEYPPTYEEATRSWQQIPQVHRARHSTGSVVICIPVVDDMGDRSPKLVNILPGAAGNSSTPRSSIPSIYDSAPSSLAPSRSISIDATAQAQPRVSESNSEMSMTSSFQSSPSAASFRSSRSPASRRMTSPRRRTILEIAMRDRSKSPRPSGTTTPSAAEVT